jgi:uncharacterized RDD family membrane protein YckC
MRTSYHPQTDRPSFWLFDRQVRKALAVGLVLVTLAQPLFAQDANAAPDTNATVDSDAPAAASNQVKLEDAETRPPSDDSGEPADEGTGNSKSMGVNRQAMIIFRRNAVLKTNDSAETVVVIGGSAKIHGHVRDAVVVIGGDIEIDGTARDVIAILGSIKASKGAKLKGDVVAVGGSMVLEDGVSLNRKPVEIDLGGLSMGVRTWIFQCLFKLRPLAPQVGWVWLVAAFFFLIYLLIALVLPGPVRLCAGELATRPATTFFMGLLTKMLLPVVFLILAATGIGALVVPFIGAALAFGAMVGKVALFESIGFGLGRRLSSGIRQSPLVAFLLGIGLITLLYTVPVLGLLALGVVSVWGLGGAVTAAFGAFRRESLSKPTSPLPSEPSLSGDDRPPSATQESAAAASPATNLPPASLPEALSNRRATFWERMGAGFLDFVILGVLSILAHGIPPFSFLIALAYFSGMWAWKGTTLGGVVLGLKVVRLDGQPLTFLVALVRSLAAAFSIFVFFLGFLWIGWDKEKQGWHDRIAGTVVVRLPRSLPLVCL